LFAGHDLGVADGKPASLAGGAGARPDHPIMRPWTHGRTGVLHAARQGWNV